MADDYHDDEQLEPCTFKTAIDDLILCAGHLFAHLLEEGDHGAIAYFSETEGNADGELTSFEVSFDFSSLVLHTVTGRHRLTITCNSHLTGDPAEARVGEL